MCNAKYISVVFTQQKKRKKAIWFAPCSSGYYSHGVVFVLSALQKESLECDSVCD